jgi:hypothetical protein
VALLVLESEIGGFAPSLGAEAPGVTRGFRAILSTRKEAVFTNHFNRLRDHQKMHSDRTARLFCPYQLSQMPGIRIRKTTMRESFHSKKQSRNDASDLSDRHSKPYGEAAGFPTTVIHRLNTEEPLKTFLFG